MDVTFELKNYIETNEVGGALLLSGKWGCGKTYLIRNIIKNLDKDKFSVVIVSLFGVDSVTSLSSMVKQKVFFSNVALPKGAAEKATKFKGWLATTLNTLKEHTELGKTISTVLSINPLDFMQIESMICKDRQLVLVFDDFERSKIDVVDLLGTINEFVESKRIKTILVADEDKVLDKKYSEFKEKVIYHTVRLIPNFQETIMSIIENYTETTKGYKDFLERRRSTIITVFEQSRSDNLRTLKLLIIDFERVYESVETLKLPDDVIDSMLYAFGTALFREKDRMINASKGVLNRKETLSESIRSQYDRGPIGPVLDWIQKGIWDKEAICDYYRRQYCQEEPSDDIKLLEWDFWKLTDAIVQTGFPTLLQNAYSGMLSCDALINFLKLIADMRNHDIPIPHDIDYIRMNLGLDERLQKIIDGRVVEPQLHTFISDDTLETMEIPEKDLYRKAFNTGNDLLSSWRTRRNFINSVTGGKESDLRKLRDQYYVSLDQEMMECVYMRYTSADNDTRRILMSIINEFYIKDLNEEALKTTLENLKELNSRIEALQKRESDNFSRAIDSLFSTSLSAKIVEIDARFSTSEMGSR